MYPLRIPRARLITRPGPSTSTSLGSLVGLLDDGLGNGTYPADMRDDEHRTPRSTARVVALCIAVLMVVGFAYYYVTQPCWPGEKQISIAGGTYCQRKARVDTD